MRRRVARLAVGCLGNKLRTNAARSCGLNLASPTLRPGTLAAQCDRAIRLQKPIFELAERLHVKYAELTGFQRFDCTVARLLVILVHLQSSFEDLSEVTLTDHVFEVDDQSRGRLDEAVLDVFEKLRVLFQDFQQRPRLILLRPFGLNFSLKIVSKNQMKYDKGGVVVILSHPSLFRMLRVAKNLRQSVVDFVKSGSTPVIGVPARKHHFISGKADVHGSPF